MQLLIKIVTGLLQQLVKPSLKSYVQIWQEHHNQFVNKRKVLVLGHLVLHVQLIVLKLLDHLTMTIVKHMI